MKDMPLDLPQSVSQVQRQRRPHAMHSTCALSLLETILACCQARWLNPPRLLGLRLGRYSQEGTGSPPILIY